MTAPTLAGDLQKVRRDLDDATEAVLLWGATRDGDPTRCVEPALVAAIESVTRAVSTLALAVEREAQQP